MTTPDSFTPLAVQWRCERRILTAELRRIERRLAELEEMLSTFFPEASDDAR